jgi:hypothetical protein
MTYWDKATQEQRLDANGISDFPSDILNSASEAVEAMPPRPPFKFDVELAIAKAILAERERCAKIAEGNAAQFDFQASLADGNDLEVGANGVRLAIAQEILPGFQLGMRLPNPFNALLPEPVE